MNKRDVGTRGGAREISWMRTMGIYIRQVAKLLASANCAQIFSLNSFYLSLESGTELYQIKYTSDCQFMLSDDIDSDCTLFTVHYDCLRSTRWTIRN